MLKSYIRSERNHLILYAIGLEDINGFTGIILYDNQMFYFDKNKIFKSNSPKADLINRDEETWSLIFNDYDNYVITDYNKFIFEQIQKYDVYISVLEGKTLFFSNKNSEQVFSLDLLSLLKGEIHTEKSLLEFLSKDIDLHLSLMKLEKLIITINLFKSTKLNQKLSKLLANYGISLK